MRTGPTVAVLCFLLQGFVLVYSRPYFLYDAINDFGFRLYQAAHATNENNLCPSFNLATVLTGLLQGARGATSHELQKVLGYKNNKRLQQDSIVPYLHDVLLHLGNDQSGYLFSNKLSVPSKARVSAPFRSTIVDELFFNLTENGSQNQLNLQTSLNFRGIWKYAFEKTKTKPEPFYLNNGQTTIYVPMMYMKGYFMHAEDMDLNAELIEIPFAGDDITMVIILPKELGGIEHQRLYMEKTQVSFALSQLHRIGTHLRLPMFSISKNLPAINKLRSLGLEKMFTPGAADFTLIEEHNKLAVSNLDLFSSLVVSEEGSMPAPPTNISDGLTPSDYDQEPMTYFTVDHPFHYLIRHKPSGLILSIGQVMVP